tara:strand:+ start:1458 stop:1592 length:135 start_codon:yes stop_codon:yes gene_type:complete
LNERWKFKRVQKGRVKHTHNVIDLFYSCFYSLSSLFLYDIDIVG